MFIRTEQCAKCKWATPEQGSTNFECRRFNPSVIGVPTDRGIMRISAWPVVQPQQWCGEFKPNIIAAN